jgi:hypothetical protein
LIDLGFARRPLLEPNLNSDGLACFVVGLMGLVLVETAIFKEPTHSPRNPGDPHAHEAMQAQPRVPRAALPVAPRIWHNGKRWLAALGNLGIVGGLFSLGWRVYARHTIGLAMAVCYLILPYSRIALLDSGQLVAASLFVLALSAYRKPAAAGALVGAGAAWMPAAFGLIPLWAGFYWGRGAWRFLLVALSILTVALLATWQWPEVSLWMRALGARRLSEAGLLPGSEIPRAGSFWTRVEPAYRLPVFVLYVALVAIVSIWPLRKNIGQLMALSAVLLLASQFWYLDEGGTLVVLYLPMVLGMVFRPIRAHARHGTSHGWIDVSAACPPRRRS